MDIFAITGGINIYLSICYIKRIDKKTIEPKIAKDISEDLKDNSIITSLSFRIIVSSQIEENELDREGTRYIASILGNNKTLKGFDLSKAI